MSIADRAAFVAHSLNADLPDDVRDRIETSERSQAQPRRILLIGGGGYIGAPITTELLRTGYQVRNLDLNLFENEGVSLAFMAHPSYEFVRGDFASETDLSAALDGVTDVVLLGGLVGDPITKKYPAESELINDIGIRRTIDLLTGRGLNNVIFVSTCSNYGLIETDELANETHELKPLSLYAKAKVSAEQHLLSRQRHVDYTPTVLRFATAFGLAPRMRFDLTVNEFTRELFLGRELLVFDADTWRPYCHVRDFARAIRRVLEFPNDVTAFEVFNAGGDANNATKQTIVDTILSHLPDAHVRYQEHGSDPRNYRVDFSKIRERLLFTPKFTVADGVEEILRVLNEGFFHDYDRRRNFYGNYELSYAPAAAVQA